jgi:hypothetical protein
MRLVLDLGYTPMVLPATHFFASNSDLGVAANDRKGPGGKYLMRLSLVLVFCWRGVDFDLVYRNTLADLKGYVVGFGVYPGLKGL